MPLVLLEVQTPLVLEVEPKAVFADGPVRTGPMVPKLGLVPNLGPVPGPVPQNYPKFNTFSVY